jgi:ribosomal protein S18 acetylase RimI-like enzyme
VETTRRGGPDDRPQLAQLARQAREDARTKRGGVLLVDEGLRQEPLEETLLTGDPSELVVLGLIDEVPVGYALARAVVLPSGDRLGVVEELYVDPEARGVSVGESMMDDIVAFCREAGCVGIDAVALPGDRATKNFFETFGLVARAIVVHRSLGDAGVDAADPPA